MILGTTTVTGGNSFVVTIPARTGKKIVIHRIDAYNTGTLGTQGPRAVITNLEEFTPRTYGTAAGTAGTQNTARVYYREWLARTPRGRIGLKVVVTISYPTGGVAGNAIVDCDYV